MENVSKFSWFKILSFFGAGVLAFACFIVIAGGINLIVAGDAFHGALVIVAGVVLGALAVLIYRNYQKKTSKQ